MSINEALHTIQKELKAPKNQYNSFGRYKYRSCEDIIEGVKQVLPSEYTLIISDSIEMIGDRFYVKATAALVGGQDRIEATAYAREASDKKGMDAAQVTGATSSYARKYALNGLFAIDDTKDSDTDERHNETLQATQKQEKEQQDLYDKILMNMLDFENGDDFKEWWPSTKKDRDTLTVYQQKQLIENMKKQAEKFQATGG